MFKNNKSNKNEQKKSIRSESLLSKYNRFSDLNLSYELQ